VQELAWKALTLWHQAHLHQPLDKVDLSIPNPMHVENAADLAGTYHGPDQTRLTFFAKAGQLILADQPDPIILESRGADRFYIHHPHFDRFLLHFKRAVADGDRPGPVIEAHYGPDCYARDGAPATQGADCPPAWDAYPGHYRAHIPWQTNLIDPGGENFDPTLHEAVATEPALSAGEDHMVARVYQQGYMFNGQLLRPARVVVKQWNG
jgi:hypothetical protein